MFVHFGFCFSNITFTLAFEIIANKKRKWQEILLENYLS